MLWDRDSKCGTNTRQLNMILHLSHLLLPKPSSSFTSGRLQTCRATTVSTDVVRAFQLRAYMFITQFQSKFRWFTLLVLGSDLKEGAAYITNAENVRIGLRISALAFFVRYYGPRPLLFSHGNVPVSAYIEGMVVVKLPT